MDILRLVTLCAVAVGFMACSALGERAMAGAWRETPHAVQIPYPTGVPHTDRQGRLLHDFDRQASFFPIGLYHGLTGTFAGVDYSFATASEAGFNTVVAWGGLETVDVLAAAEAADVQVIVSLPEDHEVLVAKDHPNLLAFDIDHEPSAAKPRSKVFERLTAFNARRDEIRRIDPDRAVFTVDAPWVRASRIDGWNAWKQAGDVASFWAYPVAGDVVRSVGGHVGVGRTVALAVEAVAARKPVWFVLQAFEGPVGAYNWRMPDADQARAMAYSALVHGATGLIWFSYDSFVTRNGKVIGISPDPLADYDLVLLNAMTGKRPLQADARQLAASRDLWAAVAALNGEIAAQRDLWLSPSARVPYTVEVKGARTSDAPIRTQMKVTKDGYVLVGVNVDADPVAFRISYDSTITGITPMAGNVPVEIRDGHLVGTATGYGVFVLKVDLRNG